MKTKRKWREIELKKSKLMNDEIIEKEFRVINRLADRGDLLDARGRCELLYKKYPRYPRVMHGLGLLRYRTGDFKDGEKLIRAAIKKHPDFAGAYDSLGRILFYSLNLEESERQYRKLLELEPDNLKAMESLAKVLASKQCNKEALEICDKILSINLKSSSAYGTYGHVMMSYGRTNEGLTYFRKSIELEKNLSTHSAILFLLNLMNNITQRKIYEESVCWAETYTKRFTKMARKHFNFPAPLRKLRIGYVSGDFRMHPVGYHLRPVLANHDKSRFDIFLYNAFPNCDAMTEEFAGHAVCYRDISLQPDEKVESLIRDDGIDILVDLAGHTGFNRLALFARRPAPVQVSWIGYFNTTGMSAMDYFISDPVTTPESDDEYFAEKIIRLPDIRFCYEPQPYSPCVAELPFKRNGYITFGSFNAIHKMIPDLLELWSKVLFAVPNSRLLLKSKSFKEDRVKEDFVARFAALGIPSDRLELRISSTHEQMLAEYGDMDISLDTFPYNGGATTCESLWMGVPVITLSYDTPIGRQTKAYLNTIGRQEWAASTKEEFLDIAVNLASDIDKLSAIRSSLRETMADSPICNGPVFTRHLESTYQNIWAKWCSNEPSPTNHLPYSTRPFDTDELSAIGFNYIKDHQPFLAEHAFRRVLKRNNSHIRGLNGLAVAYEAMRQPARALRYFKRALRLKQDDSETCYNLGCFYIDQRKYRKAVKLLTTAVKNKPGHISAWLNLGVACNLLGNTEAASDAFRKVLVLEPENLIARRQLAWVLASRGDVSLALKEIKKVFIKRPDEVESLCLYLHLLSYPENSTQKELYNVSLKVGKHFSSLKAHSLPIDIPDNQYKKSKLRIGFVSNDFIAHPIGLLLMPLFMAYNRENLEFYCYNNGLAKDHLTHFFHANSAGWREIADLNDEEILSVIRNDRIDILIELNGYTHRHRLQLFALRPAPVQVSWIGYWHTTGVPEIDYFIADDVLVLPEDEKWFSEKVIRLPDNRFCYVPINPCPEIVESPCTQNGYVTFACFGNPVKITDSAVRLWAKILKSVPGSRLVLKFKSYADKSIRNRYIEMFRGYGVPSSRLEFRTGSSLYMMMVELGDVDICLDTFPFSGGMTSLHSLWMGVPVVTLAGNMPVSRQTESFLKYVELSDLVAHDEEYYTQIAIRLANSLDRLTSLRINLREKMLLSPLCDVEQYARNVERLLFKIWDDRELNFSGRSIC